MRDINDAALAAAKRLSAAQPRADISSILGTAGAVLGGPVGGLIGSAVGGLFGNSGGGQSVGSSLGSALGSGLSAQELAQQEQQQIQQYIQNAYNQEANAVSSAQGNDKNVVAGLNNPAMSGYAPALMTAIGGSAPGAVAPTSAPKTPDFSAPGSLGATINGTSAPAASVTPTSTAPTAAQLAAIKAADAAAIQQMGAGGSYSAYHQAILNNLQNSGQFTPGQLQAITQGWINVLPSGNYQNAHGGNTNQFLNADSGAIDTILSQYDASNPTPAGSSTIPLGNTTAAQKAPVGYA